MKKVVYKHINPQTLTPFYVGRGSVLRAKDFRVRKGNWVSYVETHGKPIVEIVAENLTLEESELLEKETIISIGRLIDGTLGPLINVLIGNSHDETTKRKISKTATGETW